MSRHQLDGALICYREPRDRLGRFGPIVRSDLGYLDVDAGGLHTVYWFDAEGKHPGQVDEVTETLTNGVMDVYVISLREEWEPSAEQRAAVFHTCPISEGAQ